MNFELQRSTFPPPPLIQQPFFGSFRLEEVNVKVCGLFHSESNLLTPSCLCLCARCGHLTPCLLHALLAVPLSHCIHHLAVALSCCTRHLTPLSSPHAPCHCAPHRHTRHLDATAATAATTKPCDHLLPPCHAATTTQHDHCRHHLPQPPSSHVTVTATPRHTATTTQCDTTAAASVMQLPPLPPPLPQPPSSHATTTTMPHHAATATQHNMTAATSVTRPPPRLPPPATATIKPCDRDHHATQPPQHDTAQLPPQSPLPPLLHDTITMTTSAGIM